MICGRMERAYDKTRTRTLAEERRTEPDKARAIPARRRCANSCHFRFTLCRPFRYPASRRTGSADPTARCIDIPAYDWKKDDRLDIPYLLTRKNKYAVLFPYKVYSDTESPTSCAGLLRTIKSTCFCASPFSSNARIQRRIPSTG